MTTIAYRNGIMAGDTLLASEGRRTGSIQKVARRDDGALIGACGAASIIHAMLTWFIDTGEQGPRPQFKDDDCEALMVRPDGTVFIIDTHGSHRVDSPFAATGSGFQFALAGMDLGLDARAAVELAARWDRHTGGEIATVQIAADDGGRR